MRVGRVDATGSHPMRSQPGLEYSAGRTSPAASASAASAASAAAIAAAAAAAAAAALATSAASAAAARVFASGVRTAVPTAVLAVVLAVSAVPWAAEPWAAVPWAAEPWACLGPPASLPALCPRRPAASALAKGVSCTGTHSVPRPPKGPAAAVCRGGWRGGGGGLVAGCGGLRCRRLWCCRGVPGAGEVPADQGSTAAPRSGCRCACISSPTSTSFSSSPPPPPSRSRGSGEGGGGGGGGEAAPASATARGVDQTLLADLGLADLASSPCPSRVYTRDSFLGVAFDVALGEASVGGGPRGGRGCCRPAAAVLLLLAL